MTGTPRPDRRRGRLLPAATLAAGLALCGAAVVPALAADPVDVGVLPTPAPAVLPRPPAPQAAPGGAEGGAPALTLPARRLGDEPVTVVLPSLGVEAPVVPVRVGPAGDLAVPDDVRTVGWWSGSARLGERGTTVLAGHVDSAAQGPGALYELSRVEPGASVELVGERGERRTYVVQARRQVAKTALPPEVFDQTGGHRLVLITCGGEFDAATRSYDDNVLLFAVPAP